MPTFWVFAAKVSRKIIPAFTKDVQRYYSVAETKASKVL
jgi:hypothetical protein